MARYNQLLVSTGNGVIDRNKQALKSSEAFLFIGLGGTGTDLLMKLKKVVYKQIKPDDPEASVPRYRNIKFLVVDCDAAAIRAQKGLPSDLDERSEYFDISSCVIRAAFDSKKIILKRPEFDWLDCENISMRDSHMSGGGIRQIGRFLLVDRVAKFYETLKTTMLEALSGTTGEINVHIAAGISGGTGSGIFLDVCYLVREALKEIGKGDSIVSGYFFLPDVNMSMSAVQADPLISSYIQSNGYAALKELDYCMNFSTNKDSFRMNYGTFSVDNADQPVDLCYLISATDLEGRKIKNGYVYAMNTVSTYILALLVDGRNSYNEYGWNLFYFHIKHLLSILGPSKCCTVLQHGAGVNYNILGASVAEMPFTEIATYLGARLFREYSSIYDRVPTEGERDEFVKKNRLTYDEIFKVVTKECKGSLQFTAKYDHKYFKERGNGSFVDFYHNAQADNKGKMETNSKAFMAKMKDFVITECSSSIISRIFRSLCDDYSCKLEYGPIYAHLLLSGGGNKNLLYTLDGLIAENKKRIQQELSVEILRKEEYDTALERAMNMNIFNGKRRVDDYKNALNNTFIHDYRLEAYKNIEIVLSELKKNIDELDKSFFKILQDVMVTLRDTFEENLGVLTTPQTEQNQYKWKLLSINDIKDSLDSVVKEMDFEQSFYHMMQDLFSKIPEWINSDEYRIVKLISEYVLYEFYEVTKKTITDYLSEKYEETDIKPLAKKIEEDILREKLGQRSVPLFWKNVMHKGAVGKKCFITVPDDSQEIKKAAEDYSDGRYNVIPSDITDKISIIAINYGLPLFALETLPEMERVYYNDRRSGRHLFYKRADNDSYEDWNEILPSPIPASFRLISAQHVAERNERLIALFDKALSLDVIKCVNSEYVIKTTPEFDIDKYVERKSGGVTLENMDDIGQKKLVAALQAKVTEIKQSEGIIVKIQAVGNPIPGGEEMVAKDLFCLSPVMNRMVEKEIEKIEALENKIREISQ